MSSDDCSATARRRGTSRGSVCVGQDIGHRFALRAQAEHYRDRFLRGRHLATHIREVSALESLLTGLGRLERALDVASGTGRLTPVLATHARETIQIDLSLPMLEVSCEGTDPSGLLGRLQGDARTLPLEANSCDLVFCHRLLNHVPDEQDRRQILEEMTRVSCRYVTISCLTPLIILRAMRRFYARLLGYQPVDGFVEPADLLRDAAQAGLRLVVQTPIREGIRSAAFLTFEKEETRPVVPNRVFLHPVVERYRVMRLGNSKR